MIKLFERFLEWCDGKHEEMEPVVIPNYPLYLEDSNGRYELGRVVYQYEPSYNVYTHNDEVGKLVCLIAGVDGSDEVGYHQCDGWITVCPINTKQPRWLGVKTSDLIRLN